MHIIFRQKWNFSLCKKCAKNIAPNRYPEDPLWVCCTIGKASKNHCFIALFEGSAKKLVAKRPVTVYNQRKIILGNEFKLISSG